MQIDQFANVAAAIANFLVYMTHEIACELIGDLLYCHTLTAQKYAKDTCRISSLVSSKKVSRVVSALRFALGLDLQWTFNDLKSFLVVECPCSCWDHAESITQHEKSCG